VTRAATASLAGADLLLLWEQGAGRHPIDRALLTLAVADPGHDHAGLPLGERDARLLRLRAAILGEQLEAHECCPACGERVALELECATLAAGDELPVDPWTMEHEAARVTVRALDSRDAAAAVAVGPAAAHDELLRRAVVSAESAGTPVAIADLPPGLAGAIAESVAEHDPRAELTLDLGCPDCGHRWQAVLDVASFVWAELMARAQRLLQDVHLLAREYGWSEGEILALGESRRAAYVAMVAA
jgi:hypothetical protein